MKNIKTMGTAEGKNEHIVVKTRISSQHDKYSIKVKWGGN